jgi:hypothetical protein
MRTSRPGGLKTEIQGQKIKCARPTYKNLIRFLIFAKKFVKTCFPLAAGPSSKCRNARRRMGPNGPFRPLLRQSTHRRVFLTPQGHPDSILNPFSGTFQPPPGPHRQLPEKWPKSTTAAGNCENIMRNLHSGRLKNKFRGKK